LVGLAYWGQSCATPGLEAGLLLLLLPTALVGTFLVDAVCRGRTGRQRMLYALGIVVAACGTLFITLSVFFTAASSCGYG
jgi:hypothetical protein